MRSPVCRPRVPKPLPAPNPPHDPLGAGETHRSRQPDHPLLVPPSGGGPRTRLPNRYSRNREDPIRQTRQQRAANLNAGAGRPRPQPATQTNTNPTITTPNPTPRRGSVQTHAPTHGVLIHRWALEPSREPIPTRLWHRAPSRRRICLGARPRRGCLGTGRKPNRHDRGPWKTGG